jgi:hypothetical protein
MFKIFLLYLFISIPKVLLIYYMQFIEKTREGILLTLM